jgi:alpha-mannosidase
MNQLVIYEDRPRRWEAWDTDRDYQEQAMRVMSAAQRITVTKRSPLAAEITVERPLGNASRLVQRYRLLAGSPRVDIVTDVEWHEEQKLLRALFPCAVHARRATFGIQFGHIERATHDNTSWERAQFEVPGHNWMDLSEPGLGVAVLDDGKFGRSAKHGVLGLSLLKAPNFPDPTADRGHHRFTYAVMAHGGDWRAAGVDAHAEQLNHPLLGAMVKSAGERPSASSPRLADGWQAVAVSATGAAHLEIAALKPAEQSGGMALRVVEVRGGAGVATIRWGFPVSAVCATDLFERPVEVDGFEHDAASGTTRCAVRPFQIITLRADIASLGIGS